MKQEPSVLNILDIRKQFKEISSDNGYLVRRLPSVQSASNLQGIEFRSNVSFNHRVSVSLTVNGKSGVEIRSFSL